MTDMLENVSSSAALSFPPKLPPTSFFLAEDVLCFIHRPSSFIFTAFYLTNFFLIFPLIILIIYSALREWQLKRTFTTSSSAMSHFDCFTYNIVIMELLGVFRCVPYWYGIYTQNVILLFVGGLCTSFIWYGETSIHVLTCVERYLAIVHPITYLGLRNDRGIRIRNISLCCAWLFCLTRMGLFVLREVFIIDLCLLVLSLLIIAFCSLAVLFVLIRPGPGEQSCERVDPSKHRAFYTIVSILGVLTLRILASLSWTVMFMSGKDQDCLLMACVIWLNVPTSLVLPLLFLLRAGTFRCRKSYFQSAA